MYRYYFPICTVDGPIEPPVPFGHLGSKGSVPQKCSTCSHLFEGGCTRSIGHVGHYLNLDHGACGIDGPTDPVFYEDKFVQSKVEIPRKCMRCWYLRMDSIHGFHCTKDAAIWGDFHRGLDWGTWEPDEIYLELPLPKVTTKALSRFAKQNDALAFIKEHRRVNPGLSLKEAQNDFGTFRKILTGEPLPSSGVL